MPLPLSASRVPRLIEVPSTESTNTDLVHLAQQERLPSFTTLVTAHQTAGRGRRGRDWVAPAGTSLAISVLVRPVDRDGSALDPSALSWLPVAGGVAMTDAVASVLSGVRVGFKWPNDVQVDGKKICGVLAELLPDGGVVIGAGLNIAMSEAQLPVPTATSLALEGAEVDGAEDRVLSRYLERLSAVIEAYSASAGDAEASGLRAEAVARCTTLGREVRAELPGGSDLVGVATGIDAQGRLQIQTASGRVEAVAAGDIIHLR
jgi:BirA family biotin operon repressor/biotin-[acetyl-CoA-carboxylase] ligase